MLNRETKKKPNQFLWTLIELGPKEERIIKEKVLRKERKLSFTLKKMDLSCEEKTLVIGCGFETTTNVHSNHGETHGAHLRLEKIEELEECGGMPFSILYSCMVYNLCKVLNTLLLQGSPRASLA